MTMIGSILRLQMRELKEDAAVQLRETMQRIDALGTVHRRLYQSDDVTRFDIGAYAANLASDLAQAGSQDVRIMTDLGRAEVPVDNAAGLGLVVNEILMDLFQHTGPSASEATITIFAKVVDNQIVLTIEDSGIFLERRTVAQGNLGQTLITRLSQQSQTVISRENTPNGTRVTLTIGTRR